MHERDYYFVPLPSFEADIVSQKFVEYGEFEGHYYGTALDSIRRVANSGKYCILNLHCEVCHIIIGVEVAKMLHDSSAEQRPFLSKERKARRRKLREIVRKDKLCGARKPDARDIHAFSCPVFSRTLREKAREIKKHPKIKI